MCVLLQTPKPAMIDEVSRSGGYYQFSLDDE